MRKAEKTAVAAVTAAAMVLLVGMTACAGPHGVEASITEAETAQTDILLTGAPPIVLSDVLSSTLQKFEVSSGNYDWTYVDGQETLNLLACGAFPLDVNPETAEKLYVPEYRGMDSVSYMVSCVVLPDRLTVREWEVSQLGDADAEAGNTVTYQETQILRLKPDKVYEIAAEWEEDKLETNGFYGKASYVVVTARREG